MRIGKRTVHDGDDRSEKSEEMKPSKLEMVDARSSVQITYNYLSDPLLILPYLLQTSSIATIAALSHLRWTSPAPSAVISTALCRQTRPYSSIRFSITRGWVPSNQNHLMTRSATISPLQQLPETLRTSLKNPQPPEAPSSHFGPPPASTSPAERSFKRKPCGAISRDPTLIDWLHHSLWCHRHHSPHRDSWNHS